MYIRRAKYRILQTAVVEEVVYTLTGLYNKRLTAWYDSVKEG